MMLKAVLLFAIVAVGFAQSNPPIPGTDTLSRGFDMVAGVQNNSFTGTGLLPVWKMTYTKGNTFTYKTASNDLVWAVADQLTPTLEDRSYEAVDEELCADFSQYISLVRKSFDVSLGVTVGSGTKAFSGNAKFNHESSTYKNYMKNSTVASGFSKHFWALYSLESLPPFLPEMTMSDDLSMTIQALPATIKSASDQALYNDVITYFGTHFSFKADFGGDVHLSTFVSKSLIAEHSASWVSNQLALTFHMDLFNLSGGGFKNQSSIHISREFQDAAHTYLSFRGGDLTLQSNVTVNQWVESIPQNPVYLNNTISDISVIVKKVDNGKAQLLQNVIKSYIATGKLPATDGSIVDYDAFYAQFEDVSTVPDPEAINTHLRGSTMDLA